MTVNHRKIVLLIAAVQGLLSFPSMSQAADCDAVGMSAYSQCYTGGGAGQDIECGYRASDARAACLNGKKPAMTDGRRHRSGMRIEGCSYDDQMCNTILDQVKSFDGFSEDSLKSYSHTNEGWEVTLKSGTVLKLKVGEPR